MGKDFIYIAQNGFNLETAYKELFSGAYEIIQASSEKYFNRIPSLTEVQEMEIGTAGTEESVLRLVNGGFVVVNKTIKISPLFDVFV
jgi:hypothetical protein